MVTPTIIPLLVPSACALALGLTMIAQSHHAVAQIRASAFEEPILAEDGAIRGSGYWGWRNGGYTWNAGNWGSSIGQFGGVAHVFGYSGTEFSDSYEQEQHFYYHTMLSRVSANGNVGGGR